MTGFGRASRDFPWGMVILEISSVNHRYQEIGVKLPKEISSFESLFMSLLRDRLKRGKVRLNAEIAWVVEYRTARLDENALASYYNRLKEIARRVGAPPNFELTSLLALPGVCDSPRLDANGVGEWEVLIGEAVDALIEMKKSEGEKLWVVIEADLTVFENLTRSLSTRWKAASSDALESLRTRVKKTMERFDLELDPNRVAQEVSLLADRWDVSEELARLSSHISKFREIASGSGSEGRKLDFLIQEMNREINTMGSKVGDVEFRWTVVEAKSCLERIREQIQNVE
ncbi:MAG: YicC family protein [Synergistaceae bacterium]|nr:YicC family protein [Synergistaceae bacterium]